MTDAATARTTPAPVRNAFDEIDWDAPVATLPTDYADHDDLAAQLQTEREQG